MYIVGFKKQELKKLPLVLLKRHEVCREGEAAPENVANVDALRNECELRVGMTSIRSG